MDVIVSSIGRYSVLEQMANYAQAKVRTQDLQNKSKTDLLNQLEELRMELLQLRVQKVAGGASSKLARMYVLPRKGD